MRPRFQKITKPTDHEHFVSAVRVLFVSLQYGGVVIAQSPSAREYSLDDTRKQRQTTRKTNTTQQKDDQYDRRRSSIQVVRPVVLQAS